MKIESQTNPLAPLSAKDARSSALKKTASESASDVQLSNLSSQLLTTEDSFAFDTARVAEIRQAIAEGRFSINPEAIAERLIASAQELLGSQR